MFTQIEDYRQMFRQLSRRNVNEVRMYECGSNAYPSVTSVISFVNREKFASWRAKVGNEAANKKTKRATTRGTRFHLVTEYFINNLDYKALDEYQVPLIQLMFNASKSKLSEKLDNIYLQEASMFSDKLCLAGTVDLVCEVDGELAIVDFKTSERTKPEEWLEDYFVQLAAYWAMFSEKTGVIPKKLVVFLVAENGDVQIVERRNPIHYLKKLRSYVDQFVRYHA